MHFVAKISTGKVQVRRFDAGKALARANVFTFNCLLPEKKFSAAWLLFLIQIYISYSMEQEDFLGSGNIVGEMGLLTNSKRSCTVSCETAVQVRTGEICLYEMVLIPN